MDFRIGSVDTGSWSRDLYGSLRTGYGSLGYGNGLFDIGQVFGSSLSVPYQNFAAALQKALGERQSFCQGRDVMISFPPIRAAGKTAAKAGKTGESGKTGEMTGEEYQNYICERISSLSEGKAGGQGLRGLLVLKEEALVRMQKEPAYEKQVLETLQKDLLTQQAAGFPYFGYRVVGASEAESGSAGTATRGAGAVGYGKEKSQWERRRERVEHYRNLERTEYTERTGEQAERLMTEAGRREGLTERLMGNRSARMQERQERKGNRV